MRSTTVLSLLVALVLAGMAVFGARTWLASERAGIAAQQSITNADVKLKTLVVAREVLVFGERLTADKLTEIEWASDTLPAGAFSRIGDVVIGTDDDSARFALASMEIGEPILTSKVTVPGQRAKLSTALSPGMKAISIRVNDVLGVAGFVLPGDRVDVMLTRGGGNDNNAYVDVLLQGVKVLAIDQTADDRKDQPSVVRTVTFEVSTIEAQKLVLGANVGTLSLALRNFSSADFEASDRITLQDLGETNVSENLIAEAPVEPKTDEQLQRLGNLEQMLQGLSDGLSERMDGVEQTIQNKEPVVIEKEVVVERVIEAAPQPIVRTTIGVIRNGKREEYRVEPNLEDQADNPS